MSVAEALTLTREEELHWLALKLVPGLGTRKAVNLIRQFRSPQSVFRASRSELEASGLTGALAQSVASGCTFDDAVAQQQKMIDAGASLLTIQDPAYPAALQEIYDPPLALFARGNVGLMMSTPIAIVGTRRPTPYGTAVAERLGQDLGRAGLTIVSGMARGIDTAAHKGALTAEAGTIAVLGCGVDIIYPSENRRLAEQIAATGLILSEFPMAAPAYPQNFPIRNRIIAGLSLGVIVVEGAQYSGSGITARLALEQNREVFAVPGNVTSKASWGPNLLIKEGAHLVQDWNDVVTHLPVEHRCALAEASRRRLGIAVQDVLPGTMPEGCAPGINRALMNLLKVEQGTQLDDIVEGLDNYSSSEIIAALFELELSGTVRQLPGKHFVKTW